MTSHQDQKNLIRAFLQGFTGAGLFQRLDYPGAPTYFVDLRSVEQVRASGEFDETCQCLLKELEGVERGGRDETD